MSSRTLRNPGGCTGGSAVTRHQFKDKAAAAAGCVCAVVGGDGRGRVCVCGGGYFTELGVSFLSVLVTLQHEPTVLVPGQFVSHTDGGAETRWGRGLEGGGGALHLTGGHVRDTLSSFDSADSRRPAATKRSALRGFTTSESLQRKCF